MTELVSYFNESIDQLTLGGKKHKILTEKEVWYKKAQKLIIIRTFYSVPTGILICTSCLVGITKS